MTHKMRTKPIVLRDEGKKTLSKQREKNSSIRNVNVIKIKELRRSGKQYCSKYVLPVGVENASVNVIENDCMCALFIEIV